MAPPRPPAPPPPSASLTLCAVWHPACALYCVSSLFCLSLPLAATCIMHPKQLPAIQPLGLWSIAEQHIFWSQMSLNVWLFVLCFGKSGRTCSGGLGMCSNWCFRIAAGEGRLVCATPPLPALLTPPPPLDHRETPRQLLLCTWLSYTVDVAVVQPIFFFLLKIHDLSPMKLSQSGEGQPIIQS